MNPRDPANVQGCIDPEISFTKTKLVPHVPKIKTRLTHSAESGKSLILLPQTKLDCFGGENHYGPALVRHIACSRLRRYDWSEYAFHFVIVVTRPEECQLRSELLNLAAVRHLRGWKRRCALADEI
jgi:hypothetical protein